MEKKNITYTLFRLKSVEDGEEGVSTEAVCIAADEAEEKICEKFRKDLLLKDGYVAENDDPRIIMIQESDDLSSEIAAVYQPAIPGGYGTTVPFVIRAPYEPHAEPTWIDSLVMRLAAENAMVMLPWAWENGTYDAMKDAILAATIAGTTMTEDHERDDVDKAFQAMDDAFQALVTAFEGLDRFLTEKLPK